MDHLFRDLAPVSSAGWGKIATEAKQTLTTMLSGRKLVDFKGPLGWEAACVGTGGSDAVISPTQNRVEGVNVEGTSVEARIRRVLPMVELRVPFELRRGQLAEFDRGARNADFGPVMEAAREIAIVENHLIFSGYTAAGIRGIREASPEPSAQPGHGLEDFPVLIATALTRLRNRGVDGPYAVALSEQHYTDLTDATKAGYPVLEHVRRLIDGPLISTPGLDGAVVLSMRGGDFELTTGQDFAIGYLSHDAEHVRLYIEESVTFWNVTPDAAVTLFTRAAP
jgi:uncharacterized linocin/CFP29 family protein